MIEVRHLLGACVFYNQWIPHYATMSEPLYSLLRKGKRFSWTRECVMAMDTLKEALDSSPLLRPLVYGDGRITIVIVDASPFVAGWAMSQDNLEGEHHLARFGAKTLMRGKGGICR